MKSRNYLRTVLGVLSITILCGQVNDEYQVKAAFLYNFAKFVEWPAETFQSPNEPMIICVLGKDPFGHWLKDTIDGRSIGGHPMMLLHISAVSEASACRILFMSSSESRRTWSDLAGLRNHGVLTVGESGDASEGCAMINFVLQGGRIRFSIDTEAAERGKLRISPRLLSLALIAKQ